MYFTICKKSVVQPTLTNNISFTSKNRCFIQRFISDKKRKKENKIFVSKIRKRDTQLANALEHLLYRIETNYKSRVYSTQSRCGIGANIYRMFKSCKIHPVGKCMCMCKSHKKRPFDINCKLKNNLY